MDLKSSANIYFLTAIVTGFLLTLAYMSAEIEDDHTLSIGAEMPDLEYLSVKGLDRMRPDSSKHTLVMLFDEGCKVCTDQIDSLNAKTGIPAQMKILFCTTDIDFLMKRNFRRWRNLFTDEGAVFGIVKRRKFLAHFGLMITPSYFLFGRDGKLIWMAKGVVSFNQITKILLRSKS